MTHPSEAACGAGVELARALTQAPTVIDALEQLAAAAATYLRADAAGVTILCQHEFQTAAPTSDLAIAVDALQYELGGPCLDAILDQAAHMRVDDLHADNRWPEFAAAAIEQTPVRSMLSCRLYLELDNPIGALNLYACQPRAFGRVAAQAGERLAAQVALSIALVAERDKNANLERALDSSRDIGVAMGILMLQYKITREQAFDMLRTASQTTHRKLRDIAAVVADTGTLDTDITRQAERRASRVRRRLNHPPARAASQ